MSEIIAVIPSCGTRPRMLRVVEDPHTPLLSLVEGNVEYTLERHALGGRIDGVPTIVWVYVEDFDRHVMGEPERKDVFERARGLE